MPRDEAQARPEAQDRCFACSSPRQTTSLLETPTGTFCDSCAQEFASCPDCGRFIAAGTEVDQRFQVCACLSHRADSFRHQHEETTL